MPYNGVLMNIRFFAAMACYAVLAGLAAITLEGMFRGVVWIVLGMFAVKTWIATKRVE
jgi:hypothetical protein